MAAPYLFVSTGVAVTAAGVVVTHGLSATASNLRIIITPSTNTVAASCAIARITHDINTVTLAAATGGATCDLIVMQIHSIQGGPT